MTFEIYFESIIAVIVTLFAIGLALFIINWITQELI